MHSWSQAGKLLAHLWSHAHTLLLVILAHKTQKTLPILAEIFIFPAIFKALHKVLVYLVQNCHLEMGKLKCPGCRTPSRFGNDLKAIGCQGQMAKQRGSRYITCALIVYVRQIQVVSGGPKLGRGLPCDGSFPPLQPPSLSQGTAEYSVVRLEEKQQVRKRLLCLSAKHRRSQELDLQMTLSR